MSESKRKLLRDLLLGEGQPEGKSRPPVFLPGEEGWLPATDIVEGRQNLYVILEVPGIRLNEVVIRYEKGTLIVEGERPEIPLGEEELIEFHKKEIDFGPFVSRIKMNTRIRGDEIRATYKNGFLVITLPKDTSRRPQSGVTIEIQQTDE